MKDVYDEVMELLRDMKVFADTGGRARLKDHATRARHIAAVELQGYISADDRSPRVVTRIGTVRPANEARSICHWPASPH